jgi:glutathione S-transferase
MTLKYLFFRPVDLSTGEHMTPEFKAINPTSTVPALVDGDTKIFDSNAIAIYMVEKYAKDDSLYPKDLALRTKVNERLFYVASYMFPRGFQIIVPVLFGGETEISKDKTDGILRGYGTIETFLNGNNYLTGDTLTLGDLSLWPMMESMHQIIPIDAEKYPNFFRWLERMRELPTYAINKEGADMHVGFFRQCLERNLAQLKQK